MRITIKTDIQGDVNKVEEILHNMTVNFFNKASALGFSVVTFNKYIDFEQYEQPPQTLVNAEDNAQPDKPGAQFDMPEPKQTPVVEEGSIMPVGESIKENIGENEIRIIGKDSGLAGSLLNDFVEYTLKVHKTESDNKKIAELANRFRVGREWEFADKHGREVLKSLNPVKYENRENIKSKLDILKEKYSITK